MYRKTKVTYLPRTKGNREAWNKLRRQLPLPREEAIQVLRPYHPDPSEFLLYLVARGHLEVE